MSTVNYDDKRLTQVEAGKQQALTELEQKYAGMIDKSGDFYQQQIDATKEWEKTQSSLQQEKTDFTIEQIEQQKEQAQKDYLKEQSGAYVDWQKQSNQYGTNAEQTASAGMQNTGFAESSQVAMYTAYQNRVAMARQVISQAILNYNNGIKEAQLQNNAALAEIHLQAFQQQLQYALEGFQYENQLVLELTNKKLEVDQMYHQRYQDVLAQINHEQSMAEQIRQFNLEYNEQIRQFNEEIARLKANDAKEYQMQINQLELQKQNLAEEKRQFDAQMAYQKQKDAQAAKKTSTGSSGFSSGKSGGGVFSFTGGNSGSTTTKKYTPSKSVQNKIKSLESMRGMMGSKTAIANSIVVYATQGSITMEDAEYMLKYFGYNPKDYIE